jgi:hypothetical protein
VTAGRRITHEESNRVAEMELKTVTGNCTFMKSSLKESKQAGSARNSFDNLVLVI